MTIYDFTVKDIKGADVSLSKYKGKLLLIVNVASRCGFTPQYKGLEELYQSYQGELEILAFPCNQFGGQEPGSSDEIRNFCEVNYQISFPLFEKIEVNGSNASELYQFLKKEQPGLLGTEAIKWNFTKFLVDKNGQILKRFAPTVKPEEIKEEIKKYLS